MILTKKIGTYNKSQQITIKFFDSERRACNALRVSAFHVLDTRRYFVRACDYMRIRVANNNIIWPTCSHT